MKDLSQLLTPLAFPADLDRARRSFARQPDCQTCGASAIRHGLLLGGVAALLGIVCVGVIVVDWINSGFGALGEEKLAVVGATLIIIGIQIFFSSFLLSILGLRRN